MCVCVCVCVCVCARVCARVSGGGGGGGVSECMPVSFVLVIVNMYMDRY